MAANSKIEWTQMTWNPVTGCTKVSPGCGNCYAERMAKRLQRMGNSRYRNGFSVTLHEDLLDAPIRWKTPRLVFINSMSDLFHEAVPLTFISRVFAAMRRCPHHRFQLLTKRAERLVELAGRLEWPGHVWAGVSVENQDFACRAELLRQVPAAVRFISVEPLLGCITNLPLDGIHWVIVGGESGPKARPMRESWVESILEQCREAGVPFFFKQWGGVSKHRTGRALHGRTYDEMPASRVPGPGTTIVRVLQTQCS